MPIRLEYCWIPPKPAHRPRKLTPQDELTITRRRKIAGEKLSTLAKEYGLSVSGVRQIVGRTSLATLDLAPKPQSGGTAT